MKWRGCMLILLPLICYGDNMTTNITPTNVTDITNITTNEANIRAARLLEQQKLYSQYLIEKLNKPPQTPEK